MVNNNLKNTNKKHTNKKHTNKKHTNKKYSNKKYSNKKQKGGSNLSLPNFNVSKTIKCDDKYAFFNNILGTCWMISTLMIILMSNNVIIQYLVTTTPKDIVENAINYSYENCKLLPNFFFVDEEKTLIKENYKKLLIKFFEYLQLRFINKKKQQNILNIENKKSKSNKKLLRTDSLEILQNNNINNVSNININNVKPSCEIYIAKFAPCIFSVI